MSAGGAGERHGRNLVRLDRRMRMAAFALALSSIGSAAHAQAGAVLDKELPTAAVLSTAGGKDEGGLDSVLPAALEKLGVVNITARPGLDLGAVQLAIDCVDETVTCLRQVATQSNVQIVIAPAVQQSGDEIVVTVLYFDARGEGEIRRVARRQSGHEVSKEILDAVPDMLRELFQLHSPDEPGEEAEPPLPKKGVSVVGPVVVMSAGAAIVIGGIVTGLIEKQTQSDYNNLKPDNAMERSAANNKASTGRTQAAVTNVLFGVGAATVVGGAVWLAIALAGDRKEETPPATALLPLVAPGQLGFTLVHRGGAL